MTNDQTGGPVLIGCARVSTQGQDLDQPGPRPAERIRGNTHMMMMDKNSDEIADVVQTWLTKHGLQ